MNGELRIESTDLGQVIFPFSTVEYSIVEDGRDQQGSCRVFFPPTVHGRAFDAFAMELLDEWTQSGENGEDLFFRELELLSWMDTFLPNKDRRRCRTFDPKTFERCDSLRNLTTATRTKHATIHEQVFAAVGNHAAFDVRLFDGAAYERPRIRLPLVEAEYEEFRQLALDESATIRGEFDRIVRETIIASIREDTKRRGGKRLSQQRLAEALEAFDNNTFLERAGKVVRKAMGRVLAETERSETSQAERFRDLVERITAIQNRLAAEAERRGVAITHDTEDGLTEFTTEFISVLEEMLPIATADELLGDFLRRIEVDFQLSPLDVVVLSDYVEGDSDLPVEEFELDASDLPESSFQEQYQQVLTLALANRDLPEKWSALCEIKAQFVNRTECMRLLQREAELATATVLGMAARVLFLRVRRQLTREERRCFLLLLLPNRWLNGRVPALEPLFWSFVLHMGDETTESLFSVLVLRAGDSKAVEELERRWNAFLRFYPHWLDMVRDDEREERRRQPDRVSTQSLPRWGVADPNVQQQDMATQFSALTSDRLSEWTTRYCTPRQSQYLLAYYREGLSEPEIARLNRVTQQAVNKGIREAQKRLRAGLERDGISPFDAV